MNNLQVKKFNTLLLVEVSRQSTSVFAIFCNNLTNFVVIFYAAIFLCVSGLIANAANSELDKKLIAAIKNGDSLEDIKQLVEQGANINAKEVDDSLNAMWRQMNPATRRKEYPKTPLTLAIEKKRGKAIIEFLVEKGANLNDIIDDTGDTPLAHFIREKEDLQFIEYIIKKGADVNQRTVGGSTPLHLTSEFKVIECLVRNGAKINVRNKAGDTPLHIARELKVIEYLVRNGAAAEIDARGNSGDTPLIRAIKKGDGLAIIKYLVEHGATNIPDAAGDTPIELAQKRSGTQENTEIVKYLIEKWGVDIWQATKDGDLETVMKQVEVDPKILKIRSEKKIIDDNGLPMPLPRNINTEKRTLLHVAAMNPKSLEVLKYLIKKDADTEVYDGRSMTPLFLAIAMGNEEAARYLIANGAEPPDDRDYYLPAYEEFLIKALAVATYNKERKVISETNDYQIVRETTSDLSYAFSTLEESYKRRKRTMDKIKSQIEQIKKTKKLDNYRLKKSGMPKFSFKEAVQSQNIEKMHQWLDFDPSLINKKIGKSTPLIMVLLRGRTSFEVFEFLVKKGADINVCSEYMNDTVLHLAIEKDNDFKIVEYLTKHDANVINAKNKEGRTPIFTAVGSRKQPAIEYLIKKGADINIKDNKGQTPIFMTQMVYNDAISIIEYLVKNGADIAVKDNNGRTILFKVASYGTSQPAIEYLLKQGADINAKDNEGCTPIFEASGLTTVEYLIKHGADIHIKNNKGRTPVFYAVTSQSLRVVEYLIGQGANIHVKDNDGHNILQCLTDNESFKEVFHYDSELERIVEIIRFLIKNGVDINVKNKNGKSPFNIVDDIITTIMNDPEKYSFYSTKFRKLFDEIKSLLRPTGVTKDIPKSNSSNVTNSNTNNKPLTNSPKATDSKQQEITDKVKSVPLDTQAKMNILTDVVTDIGNDKNNDKPVSESLDESADAVVSRKQNENRNTETNSQSDSKKISLEQPEEWIKPLREIKDLRDFADVQRYIELMKYADAANDDVFYNQSRKDFFKSLKKNVSNGFTRIEFILGIFPDMLRRNNFDGLKEAMTELDMMMNKNEVNNAQWGHYNACLSGFFLAMGNQQAAKQQVQGLFTSPISSRSLAIAWQPVTIPTIKNNFDKNSFYYYCKIPIHLAKKGDEKNYNSFVASAKKLRYYAPNCDYNFAIGDAILGEFDRARLHWKQYNTQSRIPWNSLFCLSFIIRQEFLAGEFHGWETKEQFISALSKEKTLAEDIDGSALTQFYFDYGRGMARHKDSGDVLKEYETLSGGLNESDVAFFMAGVATGLQDRKNPKQKTIRKVSENLQDNNETFTSNLHDFSPVNIRVQSDETVETNQRETIERNSNNGNIKRSRRDGSNIVNQIDRGYRTYQTIRNLIGR